MEAGDNIVVYSTAVCCAPIETIGMTGIISDVLPFPYKPGRYSVRFLEAICGYDNWLYDDLELMYDEEIVYDNGLYLTERIRAMFASGLTITDIARELDLNWQTVKKNL